MDERRRVARLISVFADSVKLACGVGTTAEPRAFLLLVVAAGGVEDRVSFEVARADDFAGQQYDLVCFFDSLHDMGRPVDAARSALARLAEDGILMLVVPFAGDRVEDNITPVGRMMYAGSTTMCCAHAISEEGTHVLGAQAGPRQLETVLRSAGFRAIRTAAPTPFNLVIEARR